MNIHTLGKTNIKVSEICFGTLTVGPLQRNLPVQEGASLFIEAYDRGINFFDTSELYQTYPYLNKLIQARPDAVICSKSYDYEREGMKKALDRALRGIGRDYIDLFMLHEQESRHTFRGHWEAVEYLLEAKKAGKIRAFGISTHRAEAVRDAFNVDEIEVVFPLLNPKGIGIEDADSATMIDAIRRLRSKGKGVYQMKALGGGTLLKEKRDCFAFSKRLLNEGIIDSVALGMQNQDELEYNLAVFENRSISKELDERLDHQPRELHIDDWCEGCANCVRRCRQHALTLVDGHAHVDPEKCVACGYCASVCPVFCLKII